MTLLNIKLSNGTKRLVKYKAPTKGTVVIGGRTYPTVKIGNQWWMAENLDWKFEVTGSQIPIGQSGAPTTPAAWYYDNDETTYGIDGTYKYGLLYNWYAAKYLDDNKATLLPSGWHVPSLIELQNLIEVTIPNSCLKLRSTKYGGTDEYGMNLVFSGNYASPTFAGVNQWGVFWVTDSSNENNNNAYNCGYDNNLDFTIVVHDKGIAFSLRLVKDAT